MIDGRIVMCLLAPLVGCAVLGAVVRGSLRYHRTCGSPLEGCGAFQEFCALASGDLLPPCWRPPHIHAPAGACNVRSAVRGLIILAEWFPAAAHGDACTSVWHRCKLLKGSSWGSNLFRLLLGCKSAPDFTGALV